MTQFILFYHGELKPMAPEEQSAHMGKYRAWLGGLGDALVTPAMPMSRSKLVTREGVTDTPVEAHRNGYTIFHADDLDAAVAIAQACPYLDFGALEVAELEQMI